MSVLRRVFAASTPRCAAALGIVLLPRLAVAQERAAAPAHGPQPVSLGDALQVTLGLLLVLALIFGAAWLVRRYGRLQTTAGGQLRLIAGLNVGQREKIVIVQADTTRLLVGVSPGGVRTLHVLGEAPAEPERPGAAAGGETFLERFNQEMKKRLRP